MSRTISTFRPGVPTTPTRSTSSTSSWTDRNIQAENNNNNAYFNNASFNKRMQSAGRISNLSKRYAAWALIDRDVMKKQAPLAPLFFRTVREFTLEARRLLVVPADLRSAIEL